MKYSKIVRTVVFTIIIILLNASCSVNESNNNETDEIIFPIVAEVFSSGLFTRCEGIAFNGEGTLFVSGNSAIWKMTPSGNGEKLYEGSSNLGLAPIGERDILYADFGPTNAFAIGYNRDGIVWRVSPDGTTTVAADSIGDPNFVLVLRDGTFLVSDDATDEIHKVDLQGNVSIFTQKVNHPNGMALSLDQSTLYIAQMFKEINPYVLDGRIWSMEIGEGIFNGEPELVIDLGDDAANDGLAIDILGRLYIACWNRGEVWRYDIENDDLTLIASEMPGVASLAFGRGDYDKHSIYATSTETGKVWKLNVGVEGAPLNW